jgi:hypothetical protein
MEECTSASEGIIHENLRNHNAQIFDPHRGRHFPPFGRRRILDEDGLKISGRPGKNP